MKKVSSLFPILGYLYILLPILIFFIGWCNVITALVGTFIILLSLYFAIKNAPKLWIPNNKKQIFFLISLFVIALIWVYLSGIGALVYQNLDHNCRNPLFELLVKESWPVANSSSSAILTYYIAFWLPSAVVGKIFNSIQIGYYFQVFWAALGIFLFFYYVTASFRKKNYLPIILFIFFSGMDILGEIIILNTPAIFEITEHLEWWSGFQFSSMTTQLFWVFNQAIASWLIVVMLITEKNNKNIGFLYSCLFLHSTLPAIGIFPFIIYWCIKNGKKKIEISEFKQSFLSLFTFQNIIGSLTIFIVCYSYLSSNISSQEIGLLIINNFNIFFIFIMLEVGVFLLAIFEIYKKNPLYYIVWVCFLDYPLIRIGFGLDFCMRATIPVLVILYLMICRALESKYYFKKFKTAYIVLVISLIIGAITPIHEFTRTIEMTSLGHKKIKASFGFENFYGWVDNNKFLKYFGKTVNSKN